MRKAFVAGLLVFALVLGGCGKKEKDSKKKESKKKQTIDISECVDISANGFDGMGVVSCEKNASAISKTMKQTMKEMYGDDVEDEIKNAFDKLEESIQFTASPSMNVSNGQEVEISIVFGEKYAETCKVDFSPKTITYTVSGLTSIQSVDAYEGLSVTFAGSEDNTQIMVDNSGCTDFVKNYVLFSIADEKPSYKNGETVTVNAEFGSNLPAEMTDIYVLASSSKTYTVSGLEMHPTSIENLDLTELLKSMNEFGVGNATEKIYSDLDDFPTINGAKFDNWIDNKVKISSFSAVPEKLYFMQAKANTETSASTVMVFHLTYHVSGVLFDSKVKTPEVDVDTYFVVICQNFTTDETQSAFMSLGECSIICEDKNEFTYLMTNNSSFEEDYNKYVAPMNQNYVINEVDLSTYAAVLSTEG